MRLNALASLHWRCWSGEWAVFDVGSGQTHQMDTLTAATLMVLEAGAVNFSDLASQIADELLLPNDGEMVAALNDKLNQLLAIGLIELTEQ